MLLDANSNGRFSILPRLWTGPYNPSADYTYPGTYSDGADFVAGDFTSDYFPDYFYGNEQVLYQTRCGFSYSLCPYPC